MLKKCGVTAMLLLMIISFTVGSVSTVSEPSNISGGFMINGHITDREHSDKRFTSVILDLSGQEAMPEKNESWHAPQFMPPWPGFPVRSGYDGNKDFITGKMIVQRAGCDTPSTFPVKFFRHQLPAVMGKAPVVSYRANTTIELNEAGGSYFTFDGEILVTNESIVQENAVALPGEEYNNDIMMGQTVWHQAQVSGTPVAFNFELKWNNPGDNLRLMVYTPDGHVLGPYYDDSDGKTDSRINMEIDNQNGVADGTWLFKVTGTFVIGKDEYYIRTW